MKLYAETCRIIVLLYLCHIEHGKGTCNLGGGKCVLALAVTVLSVLAPLLHWSRLVTHMQEK